MGDRKHLRGQDGKARRRRAKLSSWQRHRGSSTPDCGPNWGSRVRASAWFGPRGHAQRGPSSPAIGSVCYSPRELTNLNGNDLSLPTSAVTFDEHPVPNCIFLSWPSHAPEFLSPFLNFSLFLNKCIYFAPFRFSHIFISHPCKIKNSEPVTFSHCWLTATLVSVWNPSAPREAPSFPKACITLVSVSCHWSLPLPLWSAC